MTIDEIAKELGVSKSTVSRALSGKGRIGESTRARIQAYARENGITLEKRQTEEDLKTQSIAVVIPADAYTIITPFFHESLLGISEVASMLNYDVMITAGTVNDISGIQSLVEGKKVDGIILLRSMEDDRLLKYLRDVHFPAGLIGNCEFEDVIQVDTNNRAASESLVSMLIRQGYRRFAMAVGDTAHRVNKDRCQGYFDAFEKNGLSGEHQLVYKNFINMDLMDSIISDIFAKKAECIVCGDDVICTRIMSRLQAEGYRIPKDISIVSLYNSRNLECFSPAVTAVNISARQLGNTVGKQLIYRLGGNIYEEKVILDYEILYRKSSGKIYRL